MKYGKYKARTEVIGPNGKPKFQITTWRGDLIEKILEVAMADKAFEPGDRVTIEIIADDEEFILEETIEQRRPDMENWELKAMNHMIDDLRSGKEEVIGRNYSEGMAWYSDERLSGLSGGGLIILSHGRLLEIEDTNGDLLTYIATLGGFKLLHKGSLR